MAPWFMPYPVWLAPAENFSCYQYKTVGSNEEGDGEMAGVGLVKTQITKLSSF